MLITLLRLAFIEAKAVGSAAHALSLIQSEHFDLYTLDAWLPGTDGFELCRRVRALDPPAPILFFSGAAYAADQQKGIEAGADAYVIKPDINELLKRIEQFTSHDAPQQVVHEIPRWAKVLPVVPASDTTNPAVVGISPPSLVILPIPSRSMSLPFESSARLWPRWLEHDTR